MSKQMLHPNRIDVGLMVGLFHSSLNIPINYQASVHPMALLPASASASTLNSNSNISDLFTKPLPRHRFDTFLGNTATVPPSTSVASTLVAPTLVASPIVSDSVPTVHPNLFPIVLDAGASYSRVRAPSASDFLPVGHASYGLFRSPISVVSKALASTPVDPCALITGEDAIDLSSLDLSALDSDSVETVSSFTKVTFDIRDFGTATLTFIYSKSSSQLLHIFVDPTQVDWLRWIPLPRLTPTESHFHICGRDYLQAFALLHLIPIWIFYLVHSGVNLEE